ncbi:translation initiation factor IF-2 [Streptomyces sp. NPDC058426]|uniref:translation initiation factor IF-2 n=1 Tax=Streptomyces sp. NPDC058426 TaxID=3346493 RepID=UPI00365BC1F6
MDDRQSNARACADSGPSPGTSPPAGVVHVRTRLTSDFTVLANALAQRRGSAVTVGVAAYILSLPDGARVSIAALCAHFTEGEILISRALRELEAEGYVERRRVRLPSGRFRTCTYVHDVPHGTVRKRPRHPRTERPPTPHPTPGPPKPPAPGRPPRNHPDQREPVRPRGLPTPLQRARTQPLPHPQPPTHETPNPPTPAEQTPNPPTSTHPVPNPPPPTQQTPNPPPLPKAPPPPSTRLRAPAPLADIAPEALAVLTSLRRLDPRLVVSEREAVALAPAISRWLATGMDRSRLADTLTTGLPAHFLTRPAALLAFRLKDTPLPAPPHRTPAPHPPRPHPFQTCDTCDRVFRAPTPGLCRDCHDSPRLDATA